MSTPRTIAPGLCPSCLVYREGYDCGADTCPGQPAPMSTHPTPEPALSLYGMARLRRDVTPDEFCGFSCDDSDEGRRLLSAGAEVTLIEDYNSGGSMWLVEGMFPDPEEDPEDPGPLYQFADVPADALEPLPAPVRFLIAEPAPFADDMAEGRACGFAPREESE